MKNIAILGCGKLGIDIAIHLIENNSAVRGTTTKSENLEKFKADKINGFLYEIGGELSDDFFKNVDVLILSIPISESKQFEDFLPIIELMELKLELVTKLIFTSSIGVYDSNQGIINEKNGRCKTNSNNFQLETILKLKFKERLTILRLGGLISNERHPINSLAGKDVSSNGNAPVNLVHHGDIARMILSIIEKNKFGEIYNCVYPIHPKKQSYYRNKALNSGLAPPVFTSLNSLEKIVESDLSVSDLDFVYLFEI